MLQTAFGALCMNRASVFEWYKRFKEGRESVKYDERGGRSKDVNTQELIIQRFGTRVWVTMLTFGYSLGSEAVVMRQLRRRKRLWRTSLTCSHKRSLMGPSRSYCNGRTSALQLEEITSKGTRVSCVYYQ